MKQILNNSWTLKCVSTGMIFPAKVPGSVFECLVTLGQMDDPFWRDNENQAMEYMKQDYEYVCNFDVDAKIWRSCVKELVFEGVDTIADIFLNGKKLAAIDNMHRTWRYRVEDILVETDNELRVYLHGPIPYIRKAYQECRTDGSEEAMVGFPLLRKAHYMFGWDWGPHLPDAGIFRDVFLCGFDEGRIEDVTVTQEHGADYVKLKLLVDIAKNTKKNVEYRVSVTNPNGEILMIDNSPTEIIIQNPMLWWPNGYGEQNLYSLKISLLADETEIDFFENKIGLRTLTIHRQKDEWGESFAHCINGIDVFAMGADYIPEDNLLGRLSKQKTKELLTNCKNCNFNTIRVWGGGFYPSDWFYEICDELGLMVWQDLMFACAVYELDEAFEENITKEIEDNLRRIKNHACLALICGNNEMEMFVKGGLWVTKAKQTADYIKMYEYIFPKLVAKYAPGIEYWPASPSSGGSFDEPNDFNRGDVHYWDVWHNNVPFSEYRKYHFRYLSEFGFQSIPSIRTIETFTDRKEDLNLFSYCMEKHQRNKSANAKIMQYMQQTFLYPTDFETLVYASQLLQGEAIRYGVEHFRRNRGRCMGAIYWQLNDCWPVISWASIDYCGRWKALQYYAKRFFAPILLSCEETSMMTEEININGENESFVPAVAFYLSNESMTEHKGNVEWELRNAQGEVLRQEKYEVYVEALGTCHMNKVELPEADWYSNYVSYRYIEDNKTISEGNVLFTMPKYFHFENPNLKIWQEGDVIKVESSCFAKGVEIQNDKEDLILSDNYFDMNPGIRTIKIEKGIPTGLKSRSVYDIH